MNGWRRGRLHPVVAGTRLSDAPAAELYGWLRFPLGELHVTTSTERDPRDGITPHHRTRSRAWRFVDHIPVTSPEQTILDCAGTIRSDELYRRIVRIAQAERTTTHARLVAFAAMNRGGRGVARMKRELVDGPSPTRSRNEDEVLELLRHPPAGSSSTRTSTVTRSICTCPSATRSSRSAARSMTTRPPAPATPPNSSASRRSG
jgi:hypothetical protein